MLTSRSYNYDPSALYNDDAYPVGRFSNEFGFHSSKPPSLHDPEHPLTML
jgi:hypothetical protein